ncbi:short-chain dehydrogenase [Iodidimonas gelatinilytica]|uniref:Short-chain dehydrogenase n=1 Tax=Iodidimonas gelatinilytica TaxID=1236966 RepID=A0A5A7MQR7_9PROT|nr:NAD(P)-dependent oxidoreductase [Iodidimonas gelatinilytica]GEQ98440.1 short-chain dehydrogenase [Iodidimonas gelatinilytica]
MKTIAITGGTGFVGRHVIAAVRDAGHSVRALARRPQENEKGLVWVPGALEDQKALDRLVSGADAVIHLAGLIKALTPHQFFAANRDGTGRLLAAIQNHAPYARFVYVSSLAAREPQLSPYAASKFAAEQVVAEAARVQLHDWAIVRPPGIYGPGDQEILKLIKAAKRGFLPAPGAVKNKVSLLFGPDLATLLRDLALMDGSVHGLCHGTVLEVDDGCRGGYSYLDLARILSRGLERPVRPVPVPLPLLSAVGHMGSAVAKITGRPAMLTAAKARELSHPDWVVGPSVDGFEAFWSPRTGFEKGLVETLDWAEKTGQF